MPRQPKLRKKKIGKITYWFTKAGGETYFGNVETVSFTEARSLFNAHVQSVAEAENDSKQKGPTAGELMDLFLDWIEKNRSRDTYETRRTCCNRFAAFRVGSQQTQIADSPATKVKGADLEAWLKQLEQKDGLSAQTRRHAETSIKHCWNWAAKHPSPTPYLSPTYRPFSSVERTYVPPKTLTANDLLTEEEIKVLFTAAAIDRDQFHRFGPKMPRTENPNERSFATTSPALVAGTLSWFNEDLRTEKAT